MLAPGTRIGRFSVVDLLGSGGMGEVYRARDEALSRLVALKTLPAEITADQRRVQRFVQEARAASALNHPHIVHIYEIGEAAGVHYIAMELIDGQTLREKLNGKVSMADVLRWLGDVAEALTKAHAAGIVHRDLKPENIMIARDGYAKVLDFGLAKLVESPSQVGEAMPTSPMLTAEGALVGTPEYMSPEQIERRPIDYRSDIFSFGCVLFEAVAGKHPFGSRSSVDVLHQIIHARPASIPRRVPDVIATLIERCLAKNPADRPRAAEVAQQIRQQTESRAAPTRQRAVTMAMIAALAALAATIAILWNRQPAQRTPAAQPPQSGQVTIDPVFTGTDVTSAVISRDGRYIAYLARSDQGSTLRLRDLHTDGDTQLAVAATNPRGLIALAPDASHLYLLRGAPNALPDLVRMPLLGGAPTLLQRAVTGAKFSPDFAHYVFGRSAGDHEEIHLAATESGEESALLPLAVGQAISALDWTRDGSSLVLAIVDGRYRSYLDRVHLATRRRTKVFDWNGVIQEVASLPASDAHVIAATRGGTSSGDLYFVTGGNARQITTGADSTFAQLSVAEGGIAAAVRQRLTSKIWKVPLDAPEQAVPLIAEPSGQPGVSGFAETPDGRIAYSVHTGSGRRIRVADPDGRNAVALTQAETDSYPSISSDGRFVAFQRFDAGTRRIWIREIATGQERMLTNGGYESTPDFSSDGQWVYYLDWRSFALARAPVGGGAAQPLTKGVLCAMPDASPDGKYVAAWCGDRLEQRSKIMIFPAAGGAPARIIDIGVPPPLHWVRWGADSKQLYFIRAISGLSNIWRVGLAGGKRPAQVTRFDSDTVSHYELSRDGKHLLLARGSEEWQLILIKGLPAR